MSSKLTHIDAHGAVHMVDIADKDVTDRQAVAAGLVRMQPATLKAILAGDLPKGEVIATARLAGIMAAKRTADLIPLCHPLSLSKVAIDIEPAGEDGLEIRATVRVSGRTGVEMEALTAVSVTALTVYDMAKAVDKAMTIEAIRLIEKTGGKSGSYKAS